MHWFGDFTMNINKLTGGVDNSRPRKETAAVTTDSPDNTTTRSTESAGGGYSDQVKLSASSKSIQQIEAEIGQMPEVNDATVERIRSAIANGEYKIDYEKLAGKMLDFEGRLN
ncbi:flagellar biosynthesis anti-sigma factor FlgM [Parathalassolituus penaei]|uniref:Negative regulator of flagellin synthesis n=1 Tax=Parathalassolituus penaei TaxID=2997323 RepID=A0A9X3EE40_9GAMM|nr:flagellar biosynthesis anti-sigma factor FlgM [Parathalassolituus penaei]MCY0965913.1 flagellar biosynthesis anti-sigma factor FlgM [Parathalassolituus penaei]